LTSVQGDGPQSQKELTVFKESTNVLQKTPDKDPNNVMKLISNPFPDQTPRELLGRMYVVGQLVWTTSTSPQLVLNFPAALLGFPLIAKALSAFLLMRASVRIRVTMDSTPYHYGLLQTSYIPNHVGTNHAQDIYEQSGNRPIIMSASQSNTCEFDIPYMNPQSFIRIAGAVSSLAVVWVSALTPLGQGSPDVSTAVTVTVYAGFKDLETAQYICQSGKEFRPRYIRREAIEKSVDHVESGIAGAIETVKGIIEKIPVIGSIMEAIPSILDKPTSVESLTKVVPDFSKDLACGAGLSYATLLALTPDAAVSNTSPITGEDSPVKTIEEIARTPMLKWIAVFTSVANVFSTYVHPKDNISHQDYLHWMSRWWRYWRGSIRYALQFSCAITTVAKFQITLLYSPVLPTGLGDAISQVIDVRGDTIIEFDVPYCHPYFWMGTNVEGTTEQPNCTLRVEVLGSIQGQVTTPTIYMAVWRAGGPDIQFAQLVDRQTDEAIEARKKRENKGKGKAVLRTSSIIVSDAEVQYDPVKAFKAKEMPFLAGMFYTHESRICQAETATTVNDCIKRMAASAATTAPPSYPDVTQNAPFHGFSGVFKYWKGSRRMWIRHVTSDGLPWTNMDYCAIALQGPDGLYHASNGTVIALPYLNPVSEIEIPYHSKLPYVGTQLNDNAAPIYATDTSWAPIDITYYNSRGGLIDRTNPTVLVSAGEDFQYIYLVAPSSSI